MFRFLAIIPIICLTLAGHAPFAPIAGLAPFATKMSLAPLAAIAGGGAAEAAEHRVKRLPPLNNWGYQLQGADPQEIAASPFDLVVIDYSRNGTHKGRFTREELRQMQRKPDGSRRYVIAYMSIGEAETYRYYWDRKWVERAPLMKSRVEDKADPAPLPGPRVTAQREAAPLTVRIPRLIAPSWLGRENARWPGNFLVRYWYDEWQELIMHDDDSYLSRIIDAGFDGVYLDRVDVFYETRIDRKFAIDKMVDFVVELAEIARSKRLGFVVIPQNAEQLLKIPRYRAAIDAAAKEDLLYGLDGEEGANSPRAVATSNRALQYARDDGLPVMVVEYLSDPLKQKQAARQAGELGFIPYFAPRKLDRLMPPGGG